MRLLPTRPIGLPFGGAFLRSESVVSGNETENDFVGAPTSAIARG